MKLNPRYKCNGKVKSDGALRRLCPALPRVAVPRKAGAASSAPTNSKPDSKTESRRDAGATDSTPFLFFAVGADAEQGFAVFHRVTVFHKDADYFAGCVGFDFVHQFHGFDDAEDLAGFYFGADADEGIGVGTGGYVEGADDWGLHDVQIFVARGVCGWGMLCGGWCGARARGGRCRGTC